MTPRQLASAVSVGLFVALAGLLSASPAHAAFFTYSQWAAFSEAQRDAYVAGAVDSLEVSVLDKNEHYGDCLMSQHMNVGQLADNVLAYARSQPAIQGVPVPGTILQYLHELCGPPPLVPRAGQH
jgi:hypothetical protein